MQAEKKAKNEVISDVNRISGLSRSVLALCGTFLTLVEHQRLLPCDKACKSAMMLPQSFPPHIHIPNACRFRWAPTTKGMFGARKTVSFRLCGRQNPHVHGDIAAHPDMPFNPVSSAETKLTIQKEIQAQLFASPLFRELWVEKPPACRQSEDRRFIHWNPVVLHQDLGNPLPENPTLVWACNGGPEFSAQAKLLPWKTLHLRDQSAPVAFVPDTVEELRVGPSMPLIVPVMPNSRATLKRLVLDLAGCYLAKEPGATETNRIERALSGFKLDSLNVTVPDHHEMETYLDYWHLPLATNSQMTTLEFDLRRRDDEMAMLSALSVPLVSLDEGPQENKKHLELTLRLPWISQALVTGIQMCIFLRDAGNRSHRVKLVCDTGEVREFRFK